MKSLGGANGGLDAAMLYARCDPDRFDFETTAELEDFGDAIGQARAVDAMRFGVEVRREGYNVSVLDPPGMGKLPDYVQLWPGHGAGSACGKALGTVPSSTVGYERLFSWWGRYLEQARGKPRYLKVQPRTCSHTVPLTLDDQPEGG